MYQNFLLSRKSTTKLTGYKWDVKEPEGVVCLIHGIGEHAGRYDRIAYMFSQHNIAMVGMDLRGHGFSSGKRGHTAPRSQILEDMDELLEYINCNFPGLPIIMYGHSLGGNLALDYRRRGKQRTLPHAYIVTSPWITLVRKIPNYLYLFTKVMAMVKPDFIMKSKINPEVLGNFEIISKQENQHLIHGNISARTAIDGFEIGEAMISGNLGKTGSEPLKPLLLMHGSADRICSPESSRILAEKESSLCQYVEWEGFFHEIHNGNAVSDGEEVIQTIIQWMKSFTAKEIVASEDQG